MRALLAFVLCIYAAPPVLAQSESRSIGSPNAGRIQDAVRVRRAPHVVIQSSNQGTVWGTAELVGAIGRAAARVSEVSEGAPPLIVGALSARNGGRLRPHSSHQNGRDADLSFYYITEDGDPAEPPRFVELGATGCGSERGVAYCLDGTRTFQLIVALLNDSEVRIQWFLVAADLRELILAAGRRLEVSQEQLEQVQLATETRAASEFHRNHLHVRVYCSVDDRPRCHDTAPYHPWYEGEPPTPRVRPAARRRQARRRARRARLRRQRRQRAAAQRRR